MLGARKSELDLLALAVSDLSIVEEGAVVVRVTHERRHWKLPAQHVWTLSDQGLFPRQQWNDLGPVRADIGHHQAPEKLPLHRLTAVIDKGDLQITRCRILPDQHKCVWRPVASASSLASASCGRMLCLAPRREVGRWSRRWQPAVAAGPSD